MRRAVRTVLAVLALAGCGGSEGPSPAAPARAVSVEQARELEGGDEPVAVRGFLVVDPAGEARLCSMLAESHPPQCGEPSLLVEGLPPSGLPQLERAQGAAWSERPVTLDGFVVDGALRLLEQPG